MTPDKKYMLLIARSFREAGDILSKDALANGTPYALTYSILYNYRHAIELYLKIAAKVDTDSQKERTHSISILTSKFIEQFNAKLSIWVTDFLNQLADIDKKSTTFRYGELWPVDEIWIDLRQLQMVVRALCDAIERLIHEEK